MSSSSAHNPPPKSRRRSVKAAIGMAVVALALLAGTACGGKSEAELANDLIAKGLEANRDNKLAEAARFYRQALVHDPENKFAYYNLGFIDQSAGRPRTAEFKYRLSLESDPRFAPALFNLATILTSTDQDAAVEMYEDLLEIQPDNAAAHLNLGFVLREQGDNTRAEREFDRAVALEPSLQERVDAAEEAGPDEPQNP